MQCPSCGHENREGRKFCTGCGIPLSSACPSCGSPTEAGERFCGECGQTLVDSVPVPSSPAAATQPTAFANGRYQVKEFLGEGGRKRVYKAHDTVLDRDVALAVIKTEGLDPTSRARVTREAQAMARLGDHPNVLLIFDLGDEGGQPYLVLPLMPGGDVGTLLEAAEDHKLPLEWAIDLAMQVCRGLEFAHSKGIVHRDLKPGNVWLTSDGTARIGDFGLAVAIDRSRLTQEGMMVGTVSYMPPEQAMGGDVTPQSDLYSLGAMLYEMVTGRPPFLGDDSVAIIGQHINTPPVAPTWHNPQCPRALEALIMRMLAKDPKERPESAPDAITALEGVDLGAAAEEESHERDEAHALDSLAGGVFVGRQREMGELKAALEDALSGRGRMTTLVGEPGIGKTRTAEEIATYARMRGAQVLWGRCYEEQGVPPYWPWVQAIRSYVREREPERLRSEMGTGAVDIAEIVSDVRERLPDLGPAAPMDNPDQARFKLFDSVTAFLRTASLTQPMMLVLDDLHWSDTPSLMLLQFVARELGGARMLLIGTYRDVELNRQHPLAETLAELTRERLFERVVLRRLSEQDVARFIEVTSGTTPPRTLAQAVHGHTEGNPLFVTEVVRLLVQEGELTPDQVRDRDSWEIRVPEGVREVIRRRLNRLSQQCNEALTIGSVIGREFTLDQLTQLAPDMTLDMLLGVLEEGLTARVIAELSDGAGRYHFTHALIQETLLGELSLTKRTRLHARIAEALEEAYGAEAEAHAAQLARHFVQAQTVLGTDKLVHYSLVAGQRALSARAYEEAEAHLQRGLTGKGVALTDTEPAKDSEAAALLSCLGQAQIGTQSGFGGINALATLTRAFDYYISAGDVAQAVRIAAHHIPINTGIELIQQAVELVPPDSHDAGKLLSRSITPLRSKYDRVQNAVQGALEIARLHQDLELEMHALVSSACVDYSHCRFSQSLDHYMQVIQLAERVDQTFDESHARFDLSHVFAALGDLEEAARHAEAMLEVADRSGNLQWQTFAMETNQNLSRSRGDWQAVRDFAERGLMLTPTDHNILGCRALVEYELGDFEAGKTYLDQLLSLQLGQSTVQLEFPIVGAWTVPLIVLPMVARITGDPVDYDRIEATARTIISSPSVYPGAAQGARIGLALISVRQGDGGAARESYGALQTLRGTVFPQSPVGPGVAIDRLLGLLSENTGELDQAAAHFEDGLTFCREAGYRPELAWTCCDYADMLLERDGEGDHEKAIALLDESLTISSGLSMRPLMERVLSRKMSLQGIDVSSPQTSIEAVVSAVEVERPNLQPHAAPDGTVTVMFTDIEGSTAMTERLGDTRAQEVLRTHNAIIRQQVAAHQGFEVKSQGDGFMVAFSSARRALECAIAIQQTLSAHNAENPGDPIKVRIGLHTGEAIKEGGDFFGKSVILAARIASQAVGGQILVSSLLKALVESSGEFGFGEGREVELKGLAGTHQVFGVDV